MRDSPSGFSDYNPFQSGGDRPEMKKKKRKVRHTRELHSGVSCSRARNS